MRAFMFESVVTVPVTNYVTVVYSKSQICIGCSKHRRWVKAFPGALDYRLK